MYLMTEPILIDNDNNNFIDNNHSNNTVIVITAAASHRTFAYIAISSGFFKTSYLPDL